MEKRESEDWGVRDGIARKSVTLTLKPTNQKVLCAFIPPIFFR